MDDDRPTVRALLRRARAQLAATDDAGDAERLLCHALERSRAWLFACGELRPDAAARARFEALLEQRAAGTPLAYLLGTQPFRGLELAVTPATLIPRADTETLVEAALGSGDADSQLDVLDLGTGSGAVALALAAERPRWRITATDMSTAALEVAAGNARRLGLSVRLLRSDWFGTLGADERFDLIVANPPYVADGDPHLADPGLAAEPRNALVAGPEGLDALCVIATHSPAHLRRGARLWLEHGSCQGAAVRALLGGLGYHDVRTLHDAGDRERVTGGQING